MISLLLAVAVIAAVVAVAVRRRQRRLVPMNRPGATIHMPVTVSRFDEIDAAVQEQRCWCGGSFALVGETSRSISERRYRIVRLVCNECERDAIMYFDVTAIFH